MRQLSLLPDYNTAEQDKPVNVASVPQRSPFRYPGGKTWLVPLFRRWMNSFGRPPAVLIEAFAGGGIISLTAAFEKLAERIVMVELDHNVAAVWSAIFGGDAEWLAKKVVAFELSLEAAQKEFEKAPHSQRELAFQTLLRNRIAHGGILAEGAGFLKHGENGKGIHSRWYPPTTARRIRSLRFVAGRIEFVHGDAFEVIPKFADNPDAVFFIDPPYTAGGKKAGQRLYTHCEIAHDRLFTLCGRVRGKFLMTYDNAAEVRLMAHRHGFETMPVAMTNTHHAEMKELLISRDLSWLNRPMRLREPAPSYRATVPRKPKGVLKQGSKKRTRRKP